MSEDKKLKEFQNNIGYNFKNKELLRQALTTPMRGNELGILHYDDILETLGDSVLKTIFILKKYKEHVYDPEVITKNKQAIENNETLSFIAKKYFKLKNYIFKSENQQIEGTGIFADVFEAICAAVFLDCDHDLSIVEKKIIDVFYKEWESIIKDTEIFNKNNLLEFLQKIYRTTPKIILVYENIGSDHEPEWYARKPKIEHPNGDLLHYFESLSSEGFKSKQKAEQDLYKKIFEKLKTIK